MGNINEKNFGRFKALYDEAVEQDKKSFMFEGDEILTAYAKYVIEYFNLSRGYICGQCGYGPWKSRVEGGPKFCPSCHSKDYDKPKKAKKGV